MYIILIFSIDCNYAYMGNVDIWLSASVGEMSTLQVTNFFLNL